MATVELPLASGTDGNAPAAAATAAPEYDLVLVTDATASMGTYLRSLNTSLPQILALSELTSAFHSIGIIAYRDYGEPEHEIIEWSGWHTSAGAIASAADGTRDVDLFAFSKKLLPIGGNDYPEAAKTAVAKLIENLNPGRKTLAIWYCDAPPHHAESRSWGGQREKEIAKLSKTEIGKSCLDWYHACQALREKEVQVLTLLERNMTIYESYYVMLARCTGGTTVRFTKEASARDISVATVDLLLSFLDQHRENTDTEKALVETITYKDIDDFGQITGEEGVKKNQGFLPHDNAQLKKKLKHITFSEKHVRRRVGEMKDFSKRFATDEEYRKRAYKSLEKLIDLDVTAISLNPVFGELWRVVCKDRLSDERTAVVNAFSNSVGKLPEGADKENMKKWLEESYDSTSEIQEIIEKVEAANKYPAVCVDPTESMIGPEHWVRSELLEVARSCYGGVLKRIGGIMVKDLVFIQDEASCPAHLRDDSVVPKIPFALIQKQFGRAFWKLLLHLILPGTMLTARAGNVVAALAIKLGIPFLKDPASEALTAWKGKWRDLETAENWSVDIMQLLTAADDIAAKEGRSYLDPVEKNIFRNLVDYKLAELNLDTELLKARIPFTPEKTMGWIGPLVHCSGCDYDRSVTIMGTNKDKGQCGLCIWIPTTDSEREHKEKKKHLWTDNKELGSKSKIAWVECGQSDCRAGYVVYATDDLNVKPKCHYCRFPTAGEKCPWIECKKCTNRVIWPVEYRDGSEKDFQCVFCEEGRESIIKMPTTARKLIKENGAEFILGKDGAEKIGFKGRSIYNVVKEVGTVEDVDKYLKVLEEEGEVPRVLNHKPIHNPEEVKAEFKKWVLDRRVETKTCNLCFESSFKPSDLHLACGRKGCLNRVDADCLKGWYGMNKPGCIINFNALHCPFCRRLPSPKVLQQFGVAIRSVANLDNALEERGTWVYGWCVTCGAKRLMERVCQGQGATPELENWNCDDCQIATKDGKVSVKQCPGCGVQTEKTGGCNHIQCGMESCGAHWCYECGKAYDSGEIYAHMETEHGGIYGIEEDDEEEEAY